jgi:predicted transcriptional regulator
MSPMLRRLIFRVKDSQRKKLEDLARASNSSMSDLLRDSLVKYLEEAAKRGKG